MGGKSGAPQGPDYSALLTAQGAQNKDLALTNTIANRPNVNTPTGSTKWTQTPGKTFDSQAYLTANPDIAAAAADPAQNPKGLSPGAYALYHLNTFGYNEGRPIDAAGDKATAGMFGADGTTPATYTQDNTLTPAQQELFDKSQNLQNTSLDQAGNSQAIAGGLQGQVASDLGTKSNLSAMLPGYSAIAGPTQGTVSYDANSRNKATDALYARQTQYLDPQFQQSDQALRTQLLSSGLAEGSDAFNTAMSNQALTKQKAYGDARDSAIAAGGTEASQELQRALAAEQNNFGEQKDIASFGQSEATRQQQTALQNIGVASTDRQQSLNDYLKLITGGSSGGSLMGGYQTPNFPGSTGSASDIAGTDLTGAAQSQFQDILSQVNAKNANSASATQAGIGALGASAAAYAAFAAA